MAKLSGAVIAGAMLALTAISSPAFAADPVNSATGVAKTGDGFRIQVKKGNARETQQASEILLAIDGNKPVISYCIDYHHPVAVHNTYREESWKDSAVKNLGKVQWIINHSFPKVTASEVVTAASAEPGTTNTQRIEYLVYAATQVAIWSLSDGYGLDARPGNWPKQGGPHMPSAVEYTAIEKIYSYLTSNAKSEQEPLPTLRIEPEKKNGPVGGKAGPFTVRSDGAEVALTATGGKIVDADGNPVTELSDGGTFWVTSDSGSEVAIKATATGKVPSGRVFVAKAHPNKHQKLILAGTAETELVTAATATFGAEATQPAPTSSSASPMLPVTGASVTVAVVSGLVLLGGGALVLMMARRRRVKFTA